MKNYTHIALILDRSGSMASIKTDTIGGVNTFIQKQKEAPGEATMSLYQFDDHYEAVYENKNIKDAPLLNDSTFIPRGSTALLDAIGRTTVSIGEQLSKLSENERPSKVIVLIVTDGMENASKEYKTNKIKEMIQHQESTYAWEFVYIGANQDAILVAQSLGVIGSKAINYSGNVQGTHEIYRSLSSNISGMRCNVSAGVTTKDMYSFTKEDRDAQDKAAASNP